MGPVDGQARLGAHDGAPVRRGGDDRIAPEGCVHGQAEEVIDPALGLAEGHDLRTGVMPVAAQQDPGLGPVPANAPDQAAKMAGDLPAGRRLRRAQHEGDGTFGLGLVDMDRRVAALAVEAVPEGQLLAAMGGVERIVDVERDRNRRHGVAVAVEVDHLMAQADHRPEVRGVFPPRHRRLAGQPELRLRRPAERHLERRVVAQGIEVVGVFVSGRDRQDARPQDVRQRVKHPRGIPSVGDQGREPVGDAALAFGLGQQQHAAIRGDPSAIKGGADLLARKGWHRGEDGCRIGHGGGAVSVRWKEWFRHPVLYAFSEAYATAATLKTRAR